jgi:hypothetical protein
MLTSTYQVKFSVGGREIPRRLGRSMDSPMPILRWWRRNDDRITAHPEMEPPETERPETERIFL